MQSSGHVDKSSGNMPHRVSHQQDAQKGIYSRHSSVELAFYLPETTQLHVHFERGSVLVATLVATPNENVNMEIRQNVHANIGATYVQCQ